MREWMDDMYGVTRGFGRSLEEARRGAAGCLVPWSPEWVSAALPPIRLGLRDCYRRFPQEAKGLAGHAGHVPVWEDEVMQWLHLVGLLRGGLRVEFVTGHGAECDFALTPPSSWLDCIASYLVVRDLLEGPAMGKLRAILPDAHMRRLFAWACLSSGLLARFNLRGLLRISPAHFNLRALLHALPAQSNLREHVGTIPESDLPRMPELMLNAEDCVARDGLSDLPYIRDFYLLEGLRSWTAGRLMWTCV